MSKELTLIERIGVEFAERDGLFYPVLDGNGSDASGDGIDVSEGIKTKNIGKYGHLWINFMKEAYPERHRSLVRFGLLEEKAAAVNEEAYELLYVMEEIVLKEVVNVFH